MRGLVLMATVFLISMSGCSKVNSIDPTGSGDSLSWLNSSLEGKTVSIQLRDGTVRKGDGIRVRADSTFWYENQAVENRTSVPTSAISKISHRQRGKLAWRYLKYGLLGGGVAGAVLGAALGEGLDGTTSGAVGGALFLGGITGAMGAGTGAVIGFLFAPEVAYVFQ